MIRMTLSRTIFIYFLIVILISLVATAFITYWQSSKEFDQYMYKHMSQTVNNAVHHTNVYLGEYERTVLSLLANEDIKKFVSLNSNEYYHHHLYSTRIKKFNFRPALIRNPEIASIYLLGDNGQYVFIYGNIPGLHEYNEKFDAKETYRFLDSNTNRSSKLEVLDQSAVSSKEAGLLTLSQRVSKLDNIYDYNGIIAIEIHKNELEQLWEGIDLGERGYFFVVNDEGKIIYHPDAKSNGKQIEQELGVKLTSSIAGQLIRYDHEDEERVFLTRPANYEGWNLVVSMPLGEMRKPIDNIRRNTIYMSGITLLIAIMFAIRFGRSIVGPIRTLRQGMLQTEKGNWVQLPLTGRHDELDQLTRRYNVMVARLSELVEEVYMAELKESEIKMERQQAELQALQLQVNPHFLYNTLETISCYAVIQDSKEITDIVKCLADMFRYAVKTDLEEVTIANELMHVLSYLKIMNYRTGLEFEIDVVVPPDYFLRNMVRLTLQPLIENAFQHAFPDGLEEHHYIRINAFIEDNEFIVTVEDNGVGMTATRINELMEKLKLNKLPALKPNHRDGIGVVNVHRRIQMVFGEQYGLSIESVAGEGTIMLLRMPNIT